MKKSHLELERKMLNKLYETLYTQFGLSLDLEEQREVFRIVHRHYIDHKREYGLLVQSTDPFKFIAWAGLTIIHQVKSKSVEKKKYLATTVACMLMMLKKGNKTLDTVFLKKLILMTLNDKDLKTDKLAIGQNGLYMAFRSANEVICNSKIDTSSTKFGGTAQE